MRARHDVVVHAEIADARHLHVRRTRALAVTRRAPADVEDDVFDEHLGGAHRA